MWLKEGGETLDKLLGSLGYSISLLHKLKESSLIIFLV